MRQYAPMMDRLLLLAPALLLLGGLGAALVVFVALSASGRPPRLVGVKHNQLFGVFCGRFLAWLLGPIERALLGRVSPNTVTAISLLLCALTGVAAGIGHLGAAVWLFLAAGVLDVLDGRLARLSGQQTAAGALFDSVSDRWGELFAFAGYSWFVHESPWLFAVLAAAAGSMMVSYTRARAEGLGIELSGGIMQRAERLVLVAGGTLAAAWAAAAPETAHLATPILGGALAFCGLASGVTAIGRWIHAYRLLAQRPPTPIVETVATDPTPATGVTPARALGTASAAVLPHPN